MKSIPFILVAVFVFGLAYVDNVRKVEQEVAQLETIQAEEEVKLKVGEDAD